MTTAEINIWIRTRAKEARVVLQAVKRDLERMAAAGANAGGVMDALSGASRGFAVNMRTANAAAAQLARSLALVNKSAGPAAKNMMNLGVAAELLPPAFRNAAVAGQSFSSALNRIAISARNAQAPLAQLGAAGNSLRSLSTIGSRGVKNIMDLGIAAELAGPAMTQAAAAARGLTTSLNGLTVSANRAAAAMRAFNAAAGMAATGATKYATGTRTAAAASTAAAAQMGAAGAAAASAAASTAAMGGAARGAQGSLGSFGNSARLVGDNAAHLDNNLWKASDRMRKIGSQAQWTGRQLAVMFTAPTLLAAGAGMMWTLEYEKAFTRMKKVYNDNLDDLGGEGPEFSGSKFDRFFTALSNTLGHAREELADVGADFAQAGLTGAQLAKAVQLTGEFSILGDQDLKQSTTDLISVMAQYKINVDEMREGVAHLNAISNETPISMANLTTGFARTASVAREAGVDIRQLGAFLAAITPAAGTAAVTANGLKSIFTRLMVPTGDAAEMLAHVGIVVSDPDWISKNAVDRLAELSTKFEGLSQQQKFDLAKPFAGLYQINKFVALMDDMAHAQGNYQTALQATESASKSFATYQKELNTFLQSNPQKLKIAGQIIKNSLADAIVPLVPHIVWLAQAVAKLMDRFANMSPEAQKFTVIALLMLAAVGPLAMLLGSFSILFGVLGKSVYWVARGFMFLAKPIGALAPKFGYLKLMAQGAWLALKNAGAMIAHVFRVAASGGSVNFVGGFFGRMIVAVVSWAGRIWPLITGAFAKIAPFLMRVVAPQVVKAMGFVAAGLTGPIGWAIAAIIALIMLFPEQTWNAVKSLGSMLAWPFIQGGKLIWAALKGIGSLIGRLFSGIGDIVSSVLNDGGVPILAKPFMIAVKLAGAALSALPKIVVGVFQAVVSVIRKAAEAVYEAFSYINPFARHSPSLVENVTNGMGVVKDEFAAMADSVSADAQRAYAAIARFGEATAGLKVRAADFERDDRRDALNKADPSGAAWTSYQGLEAEATRLNRRIDELNDSIEAQEAVVDRAKAAVEAQEATIKSMEKGVKAADKAIKGMNAALDQMRERADALQDALQAAQEQLDYYRNAPIKGMRAMSDAIFANELAQKKLRLEIMRLEDAGQSVDDLADKYANLQGQIELLSGEREGLRQKGAGSDILGTYDKMLAELQAQQGAVAMDQLSPIGEAQAELERLQREGERLDLENSIKFDPLTRQIEQLLDTSRELSFEEIVAGITTNRAAVDGLTIAYEAANSAVEGQEEAIKVAEAARDGMNDAIDAQKDKLDLLNEALDAEEAKVEILTKAQQELEDALSAVEAEMDAITSAADTVNAKLEEMARKAKEAKDALDKLKGGGDEYDWDNAGLGDFDVPGGTLGNFEDDTDIDALTEELTRKTAEMFDGIDIGGMIGRFFGRIGDWFKSLPGRFVGWLGDCAVAIGSTIAGWAGSVGSWFAGIGSAIGGWFASLWTAHIWPALSSLPGQIAQFFMDLPGHILEAGSYVGGYIAGLILKAFAAAFTLGKVIGEYFTGGGFWEDVQNVGQAISDWWINEVWHPLYNLIMNVIPDIGRGIANYFTGGGLLENLQGVWQAISDWWINDIWHPLYNLIVNVIPDIGRAIGNYFSSGQFLEDVAAAWEEVKKFAQNLWDGFTQGISNLWSGIKGWLKTHMVDPFLNGFKDALGINSPSTVFIEFGKNLIQGLWEGIKSLGSWLKDKLVEWVKSHIPDPIANALDIRSPSRVMMGMGRNVAEGLAIGILDGGSRVEDAATELAKTVIDSAAADVAPPTDPLAATTAAYGTAMGTIATNTTATQSAMHTAMAANETAYTATTQAAYAVHTSVVGAQFGAMSATTQTTMSSMKDALVATSGATAKGMEDAFKSGQDAIALATKNATDTATSNFQSLASNLFSIMTDQIVPIFDSFGPMLDTVTGWFGSSVDNIGKIWGEIREPVASPARFVINDVYNDGIRGAWNKFNAFLDLPELGEHVAKFATGGPVNGRGTSTSDSIPALLSNNEHVIPADEVRRAGGHSEIERQRQLWRSGRTLDDAIARYALGGPVDTSLWNAAKTAFPNATLNSAHRPGHSGYHGKAMAVDLGGPMQEIANWIFRTYPQSAQLIWGPGPFIAEGNTDQAYARHYFRNDIADHFDHVHWAHSSPITSDGKMISGAAGSASAAFDMVQYVTEGIHQSMDAVRDRLAEHSFAGGIGQWPPVGIEKGRSMLLDHLVPKAEEYQRNAFSANVGAGVEQWRSTVQQVLMDMALPLSWTDLTLAQMMTESGGNPRAINLTDSNAAKGTPSKGLMQVIDPTFDWMYTMFGEKTGYPKDVWNPHSNIAAGLQWVVHRYGGPQGVWGQGHGYDQGGILEPTPGGFGTYYNHTGKPEMVLTQADWNAIYAAADNPVTGEMIETGVVEAMRSHQVSIVQREQASEIGAQVALANEAWTPAIYGAANSTDAAVKELESGNKTAETGLERFTRIGREISTGVADLSAVMMTIASALQTYNETGQITFDMIAPLLTALAGLIEKLPDVEANYMPWAGTDYDPTGSEKLQKGMNDAANFGKGLYMGFKDIAPVLLKYTASIGTAVASLVATQGPVIAAALAMAPANPIGAAIMAAPAILQAIFTILPQIIAAIVEIVPLLIKSLIRLFTQFMPDSVYAYDTLEAAEKAVSENQDAIRAGATAPYFDRPTVQQQNSNSTVTINVANVTVEAKDHNSADQFVSNLQVLAGN